MWCVVLTEDLHGTRGDTLSIEETSFGEEIYYVTTDPMECPSIGMQVFEVTVDGKPIDTQDPSDLLPNIELGAERPDLIPDWWRDVEHFVKEEIPAIPWFQPQGDPDPAWHVFDDRSSAIYAARAITQGEQVTSCGSAWLTDDDSAGVVAMNASRGIPWAAARFAARAAVTRFATAARIDVANWAGVLVCKGLPLSQSYIDDARACMDVWRRGYALVRVVGGELYVSCGGG